MKVVWRQTEPGEHRFGDWVVLRDDYYEHDGERSWWAVYLMFDHETERLTLANADAWFRTLHEAKNYAESQMLESEKLQPAARR